MSQKVAQYIAIMKLSNYTIQTLRDVVIGDSQIHMPYLTGSNMTDFFNAFCPKKEVYQSDWDNPKAFSKYSRKQYAEKRLNEINDTYQLTRLIEKVVQPVHFELYGATYSKSSVDAISQILLHDGYKLLETEGVFKVEGDAAPDEVKAQVHFEEIQGRILEQINSAKYLIWVAVAWFTDRVIMKALYDKQKQGVNVQIVIFEDDINLKWGLLEPKRAEHFTIYKIRYTDSTKMHNKFCVIDLRVAMHGSYNWTDKARFNNETIEITTSRDIATTFADEFIRLKQSQIS